MNNSKIYNDYFSIDYSLVELAENVEIKYKDVFNKIDEVKEYNQLKVIKAFQDNKVSDTHFSTTTGYGYNDRGREVLDLVYSQVFGSEDALVRHNIVSGTQALSLCLFGILRPGDELLSITGNPYDTLEEVIGIRGQEDSGSLKDFGVCFNKVDLLEDGSFNLHKIKESINNKTKMILIQRSRGYEWRKSITIEEIKNIVVFIKNICPSIVIMVDNCYGEFVERFEPTEVGVDIIAGSLIKNLGGGIAPGGGYIAGKKEFIEKVSYRLTTPGLGREVGASLGNNRLMFQGLFLSPHIVAESLKGAVFCAGIMKELGFETCPEPEDLRADIIQAIKFGNPSMLIAFCQGIQKGSVIDSFVVPEPWDMPGYESPVIMAAGAFIQGSSIELSADAPIREPYTAYLQGGLVYENVKLGILISLKIMKEKKLIDLGNSLNL